MNTSSIKNAASRFVAELADDLESGNIELAAFPEAALELRKAVDDVEGSQDHLLRLISAEPVVAAKVMKIANSVALRRAGNEVRDLRGAVVRIGRDMLRNLVMHFAAQCLSASVSRPELKRILAHSWHHSVRVGAIAYVLAEHYDFPDPDAALLAGLLHDIGKFYIVAKLESYSDLLDVDEGVESLLQQWHTGVGQAILESWSLPEAIAVAAGEHDAVQRVHRGPPDLIDLVMVANLLDLSKAAAGEFPPLESFPCAQKLELTDELSSQLLDRSSVAIDSLTAALS